MIRFNDSDIDLKDLHVVGKATNTNVSKKKPFVSSFRVIEGREQFAPKPHKVSKLPKELYELFHN